MSGKIGVIRYMILRDLEMYERDRMLGSPPGLTTNELRRGRRQPRFYLHVYQLLLMGLITRVQQPATRVARPQFWYMLTDAGRRHLQGGDA